MRAPNLLHVLPSRMVGWHNLCSPVSNISIQLNRYGVLECAFSSYSLSVEISALVTFLSNDMGSATEWRLRREQLRRDGNLNGCDGAHRHTQPLKRISFIIKWLYLFQFFCICFEGLNIHFIHHRLQKHFSSLATYHHSKTEDGVSQRFLCCICFSYLLYLICTSLVFLLYLFCISSLSSLRSPRWVVP